MKVLINAPDLSKGGGVSIYWKTIFNKLNTADVSLFCVGKKKGEEKISETIWRMFKDYYNFNFIIKHYDLVVINPSLQINAVIRDALFILIAKFRKKKVVSFFHGWDPKFEAKLRGNLKVLFKKTFFISDALIVLSSEFKDKFLSLGCKKPIFVESTTIECREKIKLPEQKSRKISLLFLSRVEKDKGIYDVLEIYKEIKKTNSDVELVVAGRGSELENCRNFIESENISDVKLLGFVTGDEKEETLSSSDIFLLPTRHGEGMPISILEAMFYGIPIITIKVGGVKDFFKNGEMGFAFDRYDMRTMKSEIEKIIHNKEEIKRMGEINRAFALNYFSAPSVAKRIEDIIRFVIIKKETPEYHWFNK